MVMQVYDCLLIVSLSCISLINVKDCLLSCKLVSYTEALKQGCRLCLKVTSPFVFDSDNNRACD